MFGAARSADLVEKMTWILAAGLFTLCILATLVVSNTGSNLELLSK
jgi:preprotein translocase subunit SecG